MARGAHRLATAIGLIGQVAARHLPTRDKQHALAAIRTLGADAAACALNAAEPQRAIELADHARGVLIAEAFDTHTDTSELRARAPGLASRFEALRDELNTAGMSQPRLAAAGNGGSGSRPWLLPRSFITVSVSSGTACSMRSAACRASGVPVAATVRDTGVGSHGGPRCPAECSRFRCDALVLDHRADGSADVRVVALPQVDLAAAAGHANAILSPLRNEISEAMAEEAPDAVQGTLAWLWTAVVRPVLDSQGLLAAGPSAPLPRVWWCPTGFLSYLPLHAAGLPAPPQSTWIQRSIMSSRPTRRASAPSSGSLPAQWAGSRRVPERHGRGDAVHTRGIRTCQVPLPRSSGSRPPARERSSSKARRRAAMPWSQPWRNDPLRTLPAMRSATKETRRPVISSFMTIRRDLSQSLASFSARQMRPSWRSCPPAAPLRPHLASSMRHCT